MILPTEAWFPATRDGGLTARLIGPSGIIGITVPAGLFRDAARRAAGI
jgi:hypothetical protein